MSDDVAVSGIEYRFIEARCSLAWEGETEISHIPSIVFIEDFFSQWSSK